MTVRTIDEIFRDFVTDGVPASGPFNPHKPDIRDTLKALTEGSENFPDNRVIRLNNANEGTANNIVVTASVAIPAAAYQVLYILNVTQENTGPVTVSGAINRALVTNLGQPIAPGYLIPGAAVLCIDTGTELRLLSYGADDAILAAAEAAADRAEDAAAAAEAAAGGLLSNFDTVASVQSTNIPQTVNYIRTSGYGAVGDGGGALYKRVPSPTLLGKDIITNGGFSSDTSWVKGTGWAISGGTANKAVTGAQSELGQTRTLVAGFLYAITYTISNYSGSGWIRPYLGYNGTIVIGAQRTANGTYTDYLTAAPLNGRVVFQAQATVACSLDNVVVRPVMGAFQSADGAWWEISVGTTVNSKQFGAFPGAADAAERLQQALDYLGTKFNGGTLIIAKGVYPMSKGLTFEYALANINIRGEGKFDTELAYSSDVSGIVIGGVNKPSRVSLQQLAFYTTFVTTGKKYAVDITCNGGSPRSVYLKDIQAYGGSVGGTTSAGYWDGGGFRVTNPAMPVIHDCLFYGNGGESSLAKAQLIDSGFVVRCTEWTSGVIQNFQNVFANGCNYGFLLYVGSQPGMEGIFMDACNFNNTVTGICVQVDAALTSYYPPEFVFDKCQIEPIQTGILCIHAGKVTARDCTILMDPYDPANVNAGIVLRDTHQGIVSGNFIEFRPGHTTGSAIKIEGGSADITITDNILNSPGTHIAVFGTSSGIRHWGNAKLGAGALFGDLSSNKAQNFAGPALSVNGSDVSPNGVQEVWGSQIVTTDTSGQATVVFAEPFKNAVFTVVACNGDPVAGVENAIVGSPTTLGFTVRFPGAASVARRVNYIAKGR